MTAEFGFGTIGAASVQPLLGIWSAKKVVKSATLMEVEISTPFAPKRSELCLSGTTMSARAPVCGAADSPDSMVVVWLSGTGSAAGENQREGQREATA